MNLDIEHFLAYVVPGFLLILALAILSPATFDSIFLFLNLRSLLLDANDILKGIFALIAVVCFSFIAGHLASIARRWLLEKLFSHLFQIHRNEVSRVVGGGNAFAKLKLLIEENFSLNIGDAKQSELAVKCMEMTIALKGLDAYRVLEHHIRARIMIGNLTIAFFLIAVSLFYSHDSQIHWGIICMLFAIALGVKCVDLGKRQLRDTCAAFLSLQSSGVKQ